MMIRIVIGVLLLCFWGTAQAQDAALAELFFPEAEQKRLDQLSRKGVYVLLTQESLDEVMAYYLKMVDRSPHWVLKFPSLQEAQVWVEAQQESGKPRVFMLNLYSSKSKVNYNLTLGEVRATSSSTLASIITIYRTAQPFASKGGQSHVNGSPEE